MVGTLRQPNCLQTKGLSVYNEPANAGYQTLPLAAVHKRKSLVYNELKVVSFRNQLPSPLTPTDRASDPSDPEAASRSGAGINLRAERESPFFNRACRGRAALERPSNDHGSDPDHGGSFGPFPEAPGGRLTALRLGCPGAGRLLAGLFPNAVPPLAPLRTEVPAALGDPTRVALDFGFPALVAPDEDDSHFSISFQSPRRTGRSGTYARQGPSFVTWTSPASRKIRRACETVDWANFVFRLTSSPRCGDSRGTMRSLRLVRASRGCALADTAPLGSYLPSTRCHGLSGRQNVLGCVLVAVVYFAALGARPFPDAEGQLLQDVPAVETPLARRVEPVHGSQLAPVPFTLVPDHRQELAEGGVGERAGKGVVLDHAAHVQVLDGDHVETPDKISGDFVQVVGTGVGDSCMETGDLEPLGAPALRAPCLARQIALRPGERLLDPFEMTRVLDLLAGGERRERRDAEVDSDRPVDQREFLDLLFETERDEVAVGRVSLDRDGGRRRGEVPAPAGRSGRSGSGSALSRQKCTLC